MTVFPPGLVSTDDTGYAAIGLRGAVEELLLAPSLKGTRWGLAVETLGGSPIMSIASDGFFTPASTTKLFTTAAAFDHIDGFDAPTAGVGVHLACADSAALSDVVVEGAGDALFKEQDEHNGLIALANAVAASGVREVWDVIGDDCLYSDERWIGSWPIRAVNMAPVSALTLDDNVIGIAVTGGPEVGGPAIARFERDLDHYALVNQLITSPAGTPHDIRIERMQGDRVIRLYGSVAAGETPDRLAVGIVDPALYVATRMRRLLEARGVAVSGCARSRHRPLQLYDDPASGLIRPPTAAKPARLLAQVQGGSLFDAIKITNKFSQNLYADLLLHRLGTIGGGSGSLAAGHAVVARMLAEAGVAADDCLFYDGSGLSYENRVHPAAVVRFLRWAAARPWADAWRSTLPTAGVDGTLADRFAGTALAGKLQAKTGTLYGVAALAGYMTAASGRQLAFAIYANDRRPDAAPAIDAMDAALALIAERT